MIGNTASSFLSLPMMTSFINPQSARIKMKGNSFKREEQVKRSQSNGF